MIDGDPGTPGRTLYTVFTDWPGVASITETLFGRTLTGAGFPAPNRGPPIPSRPLPSVPDIIAQRPKTPRPRAGHPTSTRLHLHPHNTP